MTFALDLQRFAAKAKDKANDLVGNVVLLVAQELDKRSPVGDRERWAVNIDRKSRGLPPVPKGYIGGHFRANWQLGVNVKPSGEVAGVDPTGTATLGRITAAIPDQAAGKVYWLANNTPYAMRLEHGHSSIAPEGMLGLTVVMFEGIVAEQMARLK